MVILSIRLIRDRVKETLVSYLSLPFCIVQISRVIELCLERLWIYLGETPGRGRMDQHHEAHGRAVKRIYIYPLCGDVQHRRAQDSASRWIPWEEM